MIPLLAQAFPAADALGEALGQIDAPTAGGELLWLLGLLASAVVVLFWQLLSRLDKHIEDLKADKKICTETLTGQVAATAVLTTEVKANRDEDRGRWEPINRGIAELLEHARRERG